MNDKMIKMYGFTKGTFGGGGEEFYTKSTDEGDWVLSDETGDGNINDNTSPIVAELFNEKGELLGGSWLPSINNLKELV